MGAHLLDRIGLRRVPDAVAERLAKSAADLGRDLDSVRAHRRASRK
jgi:hypothetical protein